MSKINILSENLANKIAAGEVVERPASVVKELVENAIDAESRRIFVSLSEGGTRLIQVEDDGEGMERDDASLAFQRHATSKVVREEDLTSIRTLGFRGEALPSIASISKVRLITQTSGATEGTEISLEAGTVRSVKSVGSARGSVFEIRDLFFNLPARKKFLKSAQTELSHISGILFQLALCHPTIHFRLSHGGRRLLDCPPVSDLKARFLQLFGRPVTERSLHAEGRDSDERGLSLSAFFSRPPLRRNYRKEQYLFVNRRPVKSPLLTHAVYEAYGSYLIKGEHPFFILFLTVDPTRVDVNVHPSKKEVRFQENNLVHQTIRGIIRGALSSAGGIDRQTDGPLISKPIASSRSLPLRLNREREGDLHFHEAGAREKWLGWPDPSEKPTPPYDEVGGEAPIVSERSLPERLPLLSYPASPSVPVPSGSVPLIRSLGQVYGTFLVAEVEGCLVIVDQHTAHERVLYESLLEDWRRFEDLRGKTDAPSQPFIEIQPLLVPQQVDLPLSKAGILRDHLIRLEEVGLKIEPFGETTFLIRAVPVLLLEMNMESFLIDLTDELAELEVSSKAEQPMHKTIASMACHGAVRAHQSLTLPEIESLLKRYFEKESPPTCPHGRPILLTYPLSELERLFRRR